MTRVRMLHVLCLVPFLSIWPDHLAAHSMYQSAVLLDFTGNAVEAELQLPVDRLSISFRRTVDIAHFPEERADLVSYVLSHVHPESKDSRPFTVKVRSMEIKAVENAHYLVVRLLLTPPPGATTNHFNLNYDVITHEIVTHVVLVSIRSDVMTAARPDDPLLIGIIRGETKSVAIDRTKKI